MSEYSQIHASRREFIKTTSLATAGAFLSPGSFAQSVKPVAAAKSDHPICVFSKHLQFLQVPELAKAVAAMGYNGIDLTVRKGGHIEPEHAVAQLPQVIAAIRKAGLEVPMIATDIIDPNHPLTEPILKMAASLGVKHYRTAYLSFDPKIGVAKSLEMHRIQLRDLAAINKKYNIQGAYQNHAGTNLGSSVWDIWEVIKDLDPQYMGVQYDPKHATAEGGMSWVNGMDILKNHIRCMAIKDFYWEKKGDTWVHTYVPLGEGMVDYKKVFSLVKQYKIHGPLSIHFEYPLGGADKGARQITIAQEEVLTAMKRDLHTLRNMLKEAENN
ncbi:sugar phosphate isomerase/epimerase [Rhodocytophaga rosea]|uniref:Sugar phosphate isomerase/epimerase n=1 Tax=Rhodocytophaga rosea TaxID=2704465 RepID=A0A6C0GEL7_9BACT|nr:sugar phosphate isomerase/epimerase family protein [Rhodocytophaga rosea]QHT66425.1 sugar phosphate isomerase/epimerase [Rhodocytophaga rosea]